MIGVGHLDLQTGERRIDRDRIGDIRRNRVRERRPRAGFRVPLPQMPAGDHQATALFRFQGQGSAGMADQVPDRIVGQGPGYQHLQGEIPGRQVRPRPDQITHAAVGEQKQITADWDLVSLDGLKRNRPTVAFDHTGDPDALAQIDARVYGFGGKGPGRGRVIRDPISRTVNRPKDRRRHTRLQLPNRIGREHRCGNPVAVL